MQEYSLKEFLRLATTKELCTGCGTCVSICPNSAIKLMRTNDNTLYIDWDKSKCNLCRACYEVCPGLSVNFDQLNLEVFDKKVQDVLLGNYINCFIGYSNNRKIRYNSSSGGLVTELLIFALEQKMIDGALVVKMKADNPLEAEPFIARTKEEIISASKSKYCPVSANIALKEIIRQDGKFAIVGLPCHIHGIRKAEVLNKKLRKKIVLHLGIFCSHTVNFSGTELLLEKIGIKKQNVRQLYYRGDGWPGHLSVVYKNGRELSLEYHDYWNPLFGPYFFTPLRCMCCYDHTNELADLSFGDAWLHDILVKDKEGTSVVISRSKVGRELLEKAESAGMITLRGISAEKVIRSQYHSLYFKKVGLSPRIAILRSLGKKTPTYSGLKRTVNPLLYMVCLLQILDATISERKNFQSVLKRTPFIFLRGWAAFLYYLELLCYRLTGGVK